LQAFVYDRINAKLRPRFLCRANRARQDIESALLSALTADADKFLSEPGWREFCRHLLYDNPDLAIANLQPAFNAFPWKHDPKALAAWQRGRTGYPIVDAGIRQL